MMKAWRDEFMARCGKHAIPTPAARRFLSLAGRLQRLAEAQCNGDYPADNGQRETSTCPRCEMLWAPETITRKGCRDCRATDAAKAAAKVYSLEVETQGDPRGCVLTLIMEDGTRIGVPS